MKKRVTGFGGKMKMEIDAPHNGVLLKMTPGILSRVKKSL